METDVGSIVGYLRLDGSQFRNEVAAAIAELRVLSGMDVNIDVNTSKLHDVTGAAGEAERGVRNLDNEVKNLGTNGQHSTGMLLSAILLLGPALIPLGAGALALGGAFGAMAVAGVAAFMGIKDEMAQGTAVGLAYQSGLGRVEDALRRVADVAATNILGSFQGSVSDLMSKMPTLSGYVGNFATMAGKAASAVIDGLLNAFIVLAPYLEEAGAKIDELATKFDQFSTGDGFAKFATYISGELPAMISFLGQLTELVVHLVEALLPFGSGILTAVEVFINALNSIPIGMLTVLAQLALSVFAGFKTWESISGIIEGVVETLKGLNVTLEISEGVMRNMDLAASGIGIAIAALTLILAHNSEMAEQAKERQEAYADALRESKGAIDDEVRAVAAKALEEEGALQIAEQFHLSLSDVTSATLGQKDALDRVLPVLNSYILGNNNAAAAAAAGIPIQGEQSKQAEKLRAAITDQSDALQAQIRTQKAVNDASAVTSANLTTQEQATKRLAATYGMTTDAFEAAEKAQKDDANSLAATTAKMQLESDAAGILKASLDALNGKAISAAEAQQEFDSSLVSMTKAQDSAGHSVRITKGNIDDLTTASVTVRGQLNQQITALERVVEANGGLSNSTGNARAQMERMRTQIINNAVAHGVDRAAVTHYIDTLLKIPKSIPPTKLQVDKAAAMSAVNSFKATLATLEGRVVTTYVRTVFSQVAAMASGLGGVGGVSGHGELRRYYGGIDSFMNGGIRETGFQSFANGKLPSTAMIAPDGANLVQWAERGTGDEAFIPLGASHRAQSIPIFNEVGRRLGVGSGGSELVRLDPADIAAIVAGVRSGTAEGSAAGTAAGMAAAATHSQVSDRLRSGVRRQ